MLAVVRHAFMIVYGTPNFCVNTIAAGRTRINNAQGVVDARSTV